MQPGETITPQGKMKPDDKPRAPAHHESDKPAATQATTAKPSPAPEPEQQVQETPATPWQYDQGGQTAGTLPHAHVEPVSWSASEFVDNEKTAGWFFSLAGLSVLVVAVIYFLTRDLVTVVVVALAAILFAVTAKRKPRILDYVLDDRGIRIGTKGFTYETFKSFSILEEGAFNSVQLMPLKRFMPPISLYFPPETEEKIITTLGNYLPHEERTHDAVERLMRRVRF
jgi:hypothetical protein